MSSQKISKGFERILEKIDNNSSLPVAISADKPRDITLISKYLSQAGVSSKDIRITSDKEGIYTHLTKPQIFDLVKQEYVYSIRLQRVYRTQ